MPEVSFAPCPPEEFAGRQEELEEIQNILKNAKDKGQAVLISGAWGSGKSSLLEKIRYEIEEKRKCPAVSRAFLETPGVVFVTYKDLLSEVRGHEKFGWFKKTLSNKKVKEAIGTGIEILGKAASFHPVGAASGPALSGLAREMLGSSEITLPQLCLALRSAINSVGSEVSKNNKFLALLLDNVNYSSDADLTLLKDIIRTLPPGILLFIAFRIESEKMNMYAGLKKVLDESVHEEINLGGLAEDEIIELAKLRYNLSLPKDAASYLAQKISNPFFLINCFNIVQSQNLAPTLENIKKIMPKAVEPVGSVYAQLSKKDKKARDQANRLCILRPPLPLSLIACMLGEKEKDLTRLQDELNESPIFRRLAKGLYDFAHPALREFRKEEIPDAASKKWHIRASRCVSRCKELSVLDKDLALAEHLFLGEKYKDALDLNLRLGDWLYEHFSYSDALELTERALKCSRKIQDRESESVALHQMGIIYDLTFRYGEALEAYNESLKICREIGDRAGEAQTLHQIGMVYADTNKFSEALKAYSESLEIKREIGNRAGEAKSLHQIGIVYYLTNRFPEALKAYNESLEIEREIGDRAGEAKTLHQIGMVYEDTNKFPEALKAYNESLEIEREIGDRAGEAQTLHQIGMVYEDTNKFSEALKAYNESLEIKREIGDRSGEAKTLHQVYEDTNKFSEALDAYDESLEIEREIGDRAGEAQTLHQIGMVYEDTNKFPEALDAYNESLEIKREIGDRAGEAKTLHQIGMVYKDTNKFSEALDAYDESLKIEREISDRAGEAITLWAIGFLYEETKVFRKALQVLEKALDIFGEIGDRQNEAKTLRIIERLKRKMNKKE